MLEETMFAAYNSEAKKYIGIRFETYFCSKSDVVNLYDAQIASRPRLLYDHRPMELNIDDFGRVCPIPRKKGENFRDLPGVLVGDDNKVIWDPSMERVKLKSGKPLVPDYAMKFVRETSTKPFGHLWWDEIVNTVVTNIEFTIIEFSQYAKMQDCKASLTAINFLDLSRRGTYKLGMQLLFRLVLHWDTLSVWHAKDYPMTSP
ncbi:hypothetical protein ACOSP7_003800 [Xanthoceras sorbifolium]